MTLKNKEILIVVSILVVFVITMLFINKGHFLIVDSKQLDSNTPKPVITNTPKVNLSKDVEKNKSTKDKTMPYLLEKETLNINGKKQIIFIVTIHLTDNSFQFKPVLAKDKYFGYELLSEIDKRNNSLLTINAGFSGNYGQPIGLFINNKEVVSLPLRYPSILIYSNYAKIKDIEDEAALHVNDKKITIKALNSFDNYKEVMLYTKEFGETNKLEQNNVTITIKNNIIERIENKEGSTNIPENGYLLSLLGDSIELIEEYNLKINDKVEFVPPQSLDKVVYGYECGCWLVRNGENVAPDSDSIIGSLNSNDPRTAIGIDKEGRLKFIIVDGRQPELSYGMTGDELSEYMVSKGIVNGAMLDGGASTELIINHKRINSVSAGRERMLPAGFVLVEKR